MKFILPLLSLLVLLSSASHAKVEIHSYKKNYSWNNSWNDFIHSELDLLDQGQDLTIMNGKIDNEDLKELGCTGYNDITDKNLRKDFWVVFFSGLTRAESAFNVLARSHSNHGLLQLSSATARIQCGINSISGIADPDQHLRCGVRLMSWQLEGAPTTSGKQQRPDLKGQLFGKRILLWGPLRQKDKSGRKLLVNWFKRHHDQLPFCSEKVV